MKILNVALIASIKYFWAAPYAYVLDFSVWQTFFTIEAGGLVGFVFYYSLSKFIFHEVDIYGPRLYCCLPQWVQQAVERWHSSRQKKKALRPKFTRRNKLIIRLRKRWGMWGIVVLSPVLLSLPVGAILGSKYYVNERGFIPAMLLSIIIWGMISVALFTLFPGLVSPEEVL